MTWLTMFSSLYRTKASSFGIDQVHQEYKWSVRHTDSPFHDGVVRVHHQSPVLRLLDLLGADEQRGIPTGDDTGRWLDSVLLVEGSHHKSHVCNGKHWGKHWEFLNALSCFELVRNINSFKYYCFLEYWKNISACRSRGNNRDIDAWIFAGREHGWYNLRAVRAIDQQRISCGGKWHRLMLVT